MLQPSLLRGTPTMEVPGGVREVGSSAALVMELNQLHHQLIEVTCCTRWDSICYTSYV